jgi:hypothetical protein
VTIATGLWMEEDSILDMRSLTTGSESHRHSAIWNLGVKFRVLPRKAVVSL